MKSPISLLITETNELEFMAMNLRRIVAESARPASHDDLLRLADEQARLAREYRDAIETLERERMSKYEPGVEVKLNEAGRKRALEMWDVTVPKGETGIVYDGVGDDPAFPDAQYVEFSDYTYYIPDEFLLYADELELPTKIRAYEVRIGDVIRDFEGDKMRVHRIVEEDDGTEELLFGGRTLGGGAVSFTYKVATKKVKVFGREYK